jgi:hypothetical protein
MKISPPIIFEWPNKSIAFEGILFVGYFTTLPVSHTVYRRMRSRDSSVGIATGYKLDGRGIGVRVPVGSRIFSSHSPGHF